MSVTLLLVFLTVIGDPSMPYNQQIVGILYIKMKNKINVIIYTYTRYYVTYQYEKWQSK